MKNWKVPVGLLLLLVLLAYTRMDTIGTVTNDGDLVKYVSDRWTSTKYQRIYSSNYKEYLIHGSEKSFNKASNIWFIGVGLSSLWLITSLCLTKWSKRKT
ncbi:MAG TPA: hypothetical protein DEF42_15845 [Desulfosporosinus sp.]|nr:hypothetical protein [Desulfosporosinus sp.]